MALSSPGGNTAAAGHGSGTSIDNIKTGALMLWFNMSSVANALRGIVTKVNTSFNTGWVCYQPGADGTSLRFDYYSSSGGAQHLKIYSATGLLSTSEWRFACFAWDTTGSNTDQKLYTTTHSALSLAEVGSYNTQQVGSNWTDDSALDLRAFNFASGAGNFSLPGSIAWMGLWSSYPSLNEIASQMTNLLYPVYDPANCQIFVNYGWNGTGTQADLSGNRNNGTVSGLTVADGPPISLPFVFVVPSFPAGGGSHALTATGITAGQPTVGTPDIAQAHSLTATGITTGQPAAGTPAVGQVHSLTATAITTGQPAVGTPTASESNQLTATAITTGQPTVGSPDIAQAHSLTATAITTGQPTVGTPAVGQVHSLTATAITSGQPTVGTPTASASATDSLTATGITAGAPTVATSTIGQVHSLTAAGIVASAPSAATPALGQVHVLVMLAVVAGAPALGSPLLDLTIDPARTATVAQEIRTATIASELRRLAVALENRTKEA